MSFQENMTQAILNLTEEGEGATNSTQAMTQTAVGYLNNAQGVIRREMKDNYLKGKFVGGDGIVESFNEATLVLGSYSAVLQRSGIDFALYISDVRVELFYDTKVVGRGKSAYIDMCFDEDIIEPLLNAARKVKASGKPDPKPIEAVLKKYALEGTKIVSVKINKVGA